MSVNAVAVASPLNPVAGRHVPRNGEWTKRWTTMVKVASVVLGVGIGLLGVSTWIGIGVTVVSLLALGYIVTIDTVTNWRTKLQLAVENEEDSKAKFLLFLGANPNTVQGGVPPLHEAAKRQDPSLLDRLIQAGADVNLFANSETAIHHAVYYKNDEVVASLLANGANPNIPAHRSISPGGTAYDYALRQQQSYDQDNVRDHSIAGDARTREQRKTAANRIVELIAPHVRADEARNARWDGLLARLRELPN